MLVPQTKEKDLTTARLPPPGQPLCTPPTVNVPGKTAITEVSLLYLGQRGGLRATHSWL